MVIVICGKSGSGKTTLRNLLLEKDTSLSRVVGYTTRPIRAGEVDGTDYHFITDDEYDKMSFVFERQVVQSRYGMGLDALNEENPIFVIDILAMRQLAEHTPINVIFLDPSEDVLLNRLTARGDKQEYIKKRLEVDRVFNIESIANIPNVKNILHITEDVSIEESLKQAQKFITQFKAF